MYDVTFYIYEQDEVQPTDGRYCVRVKNEFMGVTRECSFRDIQSMTEEFLSMVENPSSSEKSNDYVIIYCEKCAESEQLGFLVCPFCGRGITGNWSDPDMSDLLVP